jgi:hypothetical protein
MAKSMLAAQISKWQKQAVTARKKIESAVRKQVASHQGEIDRLLEMLGDGVSKVRSAVTTASKPQRTTKTKARRGRRTRMSAGQKTKYEESILALARKSDAGVKRQVVVQRLKLSPVQASALLKGLAGQNKLKATGSRATQRYVIP